MYRELADGLPGFVSYDEFVRRIEKKRWSFVSLSEKDKRTYCEALRQLNPTGWKELKDDVEIWMYLSAPAREGLVSGGGEVVIRYQKNGVQMQALFDANGKKPKLIAYTLLNGCDGRFELPQVSATSIKELSGMLGGGLWNEILKRLSEFNDDYFVVQEFENDAVYFQVWVNPKKDGLQTADVEYCLGSEVFHFKTQVASLKELQRLIRSVRDGGISAVQEVVQKWVQILPTPGQTEW